MRAFRYSIMLSGAAFSILLLGVHFVDVAGAIRALLRTCQRQLGKRITFWKTIGSGVAWIDYDRDGWPDLYAVNGGSWEELVQGKRSAGNALFRNNRDGNFFEM